MTVWSGKRVLVTGHTGFKGAWLTLLLEHLGATVSGVALGPEHAHGAFSILDEESITSTICDIREPTALGQAVAEAAPEVVFHLAAQALVRRSYQDPLLTYSTNVIGTLNLLEVLRGASSVEAAVIVTSDKVYVNDGARRRPFQENDPLGGSDPYSASKSCADIIALSYASAWHKGLLHFPVATARAGNVIGGGDWASDRLVPDIIRALIAERTVELRHPNAVRPWQHVLDACWGYVLLGEALMLAPKDVPPSVNFGPQDAVPVVDIAEMIFRFWGKGKWTLQAGTHPPEAESLLLDASLARKALGWEPRLGLEQAVAMTTKWYRQQAAQGDVRAISRDQLRSFLA